MIDFKAIDKTWTLFLDRDGVINKENKGKYINNWEEFVFSDLALEAIKIFAHRFGKIIIVTNQRGVSKGLTKPADLHIIHTNMKAAIIEAGGRLDALYFCIDDDENSPNRKPNPGMGLQAAAEFPDIDFKKALIIGDKFSDMQFGRNLGMYTIFLPTTSKRPETVDDRIDMVFESLHEVASALEADKL